MLNGRCQGFYCAATVAALFAGAGPGRPWPRRRYAPRRRAGVKADVLVVGAGPAGLAAAVELRRLGAGSVVVADRDEDAPAASPGTARTPVSAPVTCAAC